MNCLEVYTRRKKVFSLFNLLFSLFLWRWYKNPQTVAYKLSVGYGPISVRLNLPDGSLNSDQAGCWLRARFHHCTLVKLTSAIVPNVNNSVVQFLPRGTCVRAVPYKNIWSVGVKYARIVTLAHVETFFLPIHSLN